MYKLAMTVLAAAVLGGCSAAPTKSVNTYSYDSNEHSGTVNVTETVYTSADKACRTQWREGPVYQPKGLTSSIESYLVMHVQSESTDEKEFLSEISFPMSIGDRVVARDYQESKAFMLGADSNGVLTQGDHFFYPDGYFLRVSQPEIIGNVFTACLGLDRMYVMPADLESSTNPPIHLDRVVVPVAVENGDVIDVEFGGALKHKAEIWILPK